MLAQHGNKCGEQGDQKTCIHEAGGGDDLARWVFPNGRNCRGLTRGGRLIESEKNCTEEGGGLFVRIGLEVGMDVDDEGRADSGEQTGLQEQVR